jgi:glutamyl-tRNA reductase
LNSKYQTTKSEIPLFLAGLNYKSNPVEVREKFAFLNDCDSLNKAYEEFSHRIGPVLILSTCNRTEVYLSTDKPLAALEEEVACIFAQIKGLDISFVKEHLIFTHGNDVVEHLFKVSAGLDSMIPGEGQILHQLKNSYFKSSSYCDALLNQLAQKALAAGKKARSQTKISQGAVSVPAAALQLAQSIIAPANLSQIQIMIFGTGEVAELALELIASYEASKTTTVVSRSEKSHSLMLTKYGVSQGITYSQLKDFIREQDLIVVCTSAPHYVLTQDDLHGLKKDLIVCDMTLPRNVDPQISSLPYVNLIDLDHLKRSVESNLSQRKAEIDKALLITKSEIERFNGWFYSRKNKFNDLFVNF